MKKNNYLIIAFVILLIITIIIFWYNKKKKKEAESSWWIFSKKPVQVTNSTPNQTGCTNCWVSTVEDGMEYCRWYDNYGRNTQSYSGRGCTNVQANIGYNNKPKKSWWEAFFGL
jgi:uncharacterized protein YodC (DUF2158 family)